jgi:hypothetical protein
MALVHSENSVGSGDIVALTGDSVVYADDSCVPFTEMKPMQFVGIMHFLEIILECPSHELPIVSTGALDEIPGLLCVLDKGKKMGRWKGYWVECLEKIFDGLRFFSSDMCFGLEFGSKDLFDESDSKSDESDSEEPKLAMVRVDIHKLPELDDYTKVTVKSVVRAFDQNGRLFFGSSRERLAGFMIIHFLESVSEKIFASFDGEDVDSFWLKDGTIFINSKLGEDTGYLREYFSCILREILESFIGKYADKV